MTRFHIIDAAASSGSQRKISHFTTARRARWETASDGPQASWAAAASGVGLNLLPTESTYAAHVDADWPTTGWGFNVEITFWSADLSNAQITAVRISADGLTVVSSLALGAVTGTGVFTASNVSGSLPGTNKTDRIALELVATNTNMMDSAFATIKKLSYIDTPLVPTRMGIAHSWDYEWDSGSTEGWTAAENTTASYYGQWEVRGQFAGQNFGRHSLRMTLVGTSGSVRPHSVERVLTWNDMGVPLGATVTHVNLANIAFDDDNTAGESSTTFAVEVRDAGGSLLATPWSTTTLPGTYCVYVDESQPAVALSTPQPANATVRVRLVRYCSLSTNSGNQHVYFSTFSLGADYTTPPTGIGSATGTASITGAAAVSNFSPYSNSEVKTTTSGGGGTTHTADGNLSATASHAGSAFKITYTAWSAPDSEQTQSAGGTTVTVDGGVAAAATLSGVAAVTRPSSGTLATTTTRSGATAVTRPGSGTRTATAAVTGTVSGVVAGTGVTTAASATLSGAAAVFKEITGTASATVSTAGAAANAAVVSGSCTATVTTAATATTVVAVSGDLAASAAVIGASDSNVSGALAVTTTLDATADVIHPPQIVPPFADGALVGAWVNELGGTTNLYQSIDEASPGSLSDYVQSPTAPAASDFYRARFNIPNTPTDNTGHIVRIRHGKTATGGQDISCVVYVRQGTDTIIAQWSFTTTDMDTTDRTDVLTLSEAEAAAITDYDTLRVEVSPTVTGGGQKREYRVYWMEFEAPWAPNSGAGSRATTATITGDALVTVFGAGSPTDATVTLAGEAFVFKDASGTTAATAATGSTELLTVVASGVATSATATRTGDSLLTKVVSGDTPTVATVQGTAFVLRPITGTTTATVTPSGDIVTGDIADGTASAVATLDGSVLLTRGVMGTTEASASHAVVAATTAFASGTLSSTTSLIGGPLVTRITSGDASITATISGSPDGITEVTGSLPATATPSGTGNVIGLDTPFLTAEAIGLAQIDLDWTTIIGATGYDIERDGQIIVINHQQTNYSDTNVITGLTYVYRVRARKAI